MKKIYLLSFGILFLLSCKSEDPILVECSPTKVVITKNSPSDYIFTETKLTQVDANRGTDDNVLYDYTYSGDQINQITSTDTDDEIIEYKATYSGSNLDKFTGFAPGSTTPILEIRNIYNGGVLGSLESYYASADGTLFQIAHSTFGYDGNGNLVQSEVYLDLAALFTIAFGGVPTSYAPALIVTNVYEPSNAANPLAGTFSVAQPDFSIMKNLPASVTSTDLDGNITSETFTFESDENGNTTKATGSDNTTLTATFTCSQ